LSKKINPFLITKIPTQSSAKNFPNAFNKSKKKVFLSLQVNQSIQLNFKQQQKKG
jgi:hypothetical protein